MTFAETLLPEFDHELAGCRKELERLPEGRFDFSPHPKSKTLGALANHLASIPGWLVGIMRMTELDFSDPAVRASMPAPVDHVGELLDVFDRQVALGRQVLAAASDSDFAVLWTGKMDGHVFVAMPRIVVVRAFVLSHLIHHRAQLGVYLRLLDRPLPALYGPSADETGM